MLARCPACRNTFSTDRSGRQDCPVCGKPLVVPDVPAEGGRLPAPPPDMGSGPTPAGTPWERRSELGILRAWGSTVAQALFEPSRLFASARIDRNAAQVGFALVTGTVFALLEQVLEHLLLTPQRERIRQMIASAGDLPPALLRYLETSREMGPKTLVAIAISTPVILLVLLYVSAAVTHGVALVLGQAKRGFPATLAACAYGFAPFVLLALPACGGLIAIVWVAVLTGIGLKDLHGIGAGGAAAAVLVPYVALCCATCGLGVLLATMLGRAAAQ